MRKKFFTLSVKEHWNRLPRGVGGVPFSGDSKIPPVHGPVQPPLCDPALAGALD